MDLSRTNALMQKKGVCIFAGDMVEGDDRGQVPNAAGNHLLGNLPPDAIVTDAYLHVKTVSGATTRAATLGTADGGSQILTGANLKTLGKQGTFAGQLDTGTGVPVYLNTTKSGAQLVNAAFVVVIEYVEYTKTTGEYTNI